MSREQISAFHHRWYRPQNLVVAVAGALDHDEVVATVERHLADAEAGAPPQRRAPAAPAAALRVLTQRSEQAHVALGLRALSRHDPGRHALAVANQVLGGGTSSRLFRTIREERGLAYSVYSYQGGYADAGALVAAAAAGPGRVAEVLALVRAEVGRLLEGGVTEHELTVATGYLQGATALALEDSGSCMSRIAGAVLVHGEVPSLSEVLDRYARVTLEDVAQVLTRVAAIGPPSLAVLGPLKRAQVERWVA